MTKNVTSLSKGKQKHSLIIHFTHFQPDALKQINSNNTIRIGLQIVDFVITRHGLKLNSSNHMLKSL